MDPIAVIAGVTAAGACYVLAFRRRGRVGSVAIGGAYIEIRSPGTPQDVFDAITAIGPPYSVDDADRESHQLVLSSRPSVWSYGFLYPVHVIAEGAGTIVVVGVTSRLFHLGPGMGRAHRLCAQAIERLLSVPPARIA